MNTLIRFGVIAMSCFLAQFTYAVSSSTATPVGYWKTIDDVSGKPKSIVEIVEVNKVLRGKVVKLFEEPNKVCDACDGEKHNQPVMGMVVMNNYKADKDNASEWNGGKILDPKNGKIYNSLVQLTANGAKLNVRGYIGVPLFGRSQTWVRVDSPAAA